MTFPPTDAWDLHKVYIGLKPLMGLKILISIYKNIYRVVYMLGSGTMTTLFLITLYFCVSARQLVLPCSTRSYTKSCSCTKCKIYIESSQMISQDNNKKFGAFLCWLEVISKGETFLRWVCFSDEAVMKKHNVKIWGAEHPRFN